MKRLDITLYVILGLVFFGTYVVILSQEREKKRQEMIEVLTEESHKRWVDEMSQQRISQMSKEWSDQLSESVMQNYLEENPLPDFSVPR